jgi:hypothetical protein
MDPISKNTEIIYSLLQKELTDLAIKLVSPSGASAAKTVVRDWLQKENYADGIGFSSRHNWHLEVSLANPGTDQNVEFQYAGLQTFRYHNKYNKRTYFGDRTEGPNGVVTWQSPDGLSKQMQRPVWLDALMSRKVDLEDATTKDGNEDEA